MIDLREELNKLIEVDSENNRIIYRHYSEQKCHCLLQPKMVYSDMSKALVPNKLYRNIADPSCPNCEGSGWVFEEFLFKCLFFYPGFRFSHWDDFKYATTGENTLTLYLKIDENWDKIMVNDVFYNLRADDRGNVINPIQRYRKWIINDVFPLRLDNNKLEFIKLYAKPAVI